MIKTYKAKQITEQKINSANEVYEILAKGYSRPVDILNYSNINCGPLLVELLNKLISMEFVEKKTPINDENNKRK